MRAGPRAVGLMVRLGPGGHVSRGSEQGDCTGTQGLGRPALSPRESSKGLQRPSGLTLSFYARGTYVPTSWSGDPDTDVRGSDVGEDADLLCSLR